MGHVQRDAEGFVIGLEVPEDEFCVYGTIHAHPEHADALEAVYAQTNQLAKFEPGTLQYCISRDPEDPTLFHMFEQYAGKKAFEQHNAQPIIQKLIQDQLFKGVKAVIVKPIPAPASAASLAAPIPAKTSSLMDLPNFVKKSPQDPDCAAEAALDATFGGSGECETADSSLAKKKNAQDAESYECAIEAALDATFGRSGECV
ncbi:hypothetical protein KC363_g5723 [Hortaea werneckii]|nr:hypothetical protein KC363_g5723 [Hortaea werneckii]